METLPASPTNYDSLSMPELEAFIRWFGGTGIRPILQARRMFPMRPKGYVSATKNLYNYAVNKRTAMRCRLRGDIVGATNYETICDHIYASLPAFARW